MHAQPSKLRIMKRQEYINDRNSNVKHKNNIEKKIFEIINNKRNFLKNIKYFFNTKMENDNEYIKSTKSEMHDK